ncbi:MAG: hypothetical protein Q4E55_08715 [Bacteroidales bacterium]|nr:hypothetical protein [Bacteroidales bacterium]
MKEIKKIAKWLGIFLGCLIVFDVLFGLVMDRLWNNMPDTVYQAARTNTSLNRVEADVIVLGSSRAVHHYVTSILEDSLGTSVYNCGHDGMDLIYCDVVLDAIVKRHKPKIVILDMAEGYLNGHSKDRLDCLMPYIKSDSYISEIMEELKGGSFTGLKLCNMYRYNDRVLNMACAYKSALDSEKGYTPKDGKSALVGKEPQISTPIKESEVDELEVAHLVHLIETCEANGIQLYIVNSPRYNIVEDAMAYTKSLCSGRSVTFLDYSSLLLEHPEMFRDSAHMLDNGAKAFTKELAMEMKNKYLQQIK